jgi:hypothetical protein
MTPEARYLIACARLAALGEPKTWTPDDLMDVAALVDPPVSFEAWMQKVAKRLSPTETEQPKVADPDTTATMESLLHGDLQHLAAQGIVSVAEEIEG